MKKKEKENQKSLKKVKEEKFGSKFIRNIKKRWLISGTNTILLIAILIAGFILINMLVKKWDPTAIDCTTSQDFTLTDESKQRVANIDKEVNIYFIGWEETSQDYILAKQYNKANSKINVEIIDATENLEIAKKYDVSNEDYAIIVESGDAYRKLYYYSDIISYDSDYNQVDLAEQKITSAILNVTSEIIPKVYYLTGYTSLTFTNGLSGLSQYLDDEVLTYEELNILNTQKVPDDCDTLIIMTPEKDFDTTTTNAIMDYIKRGGNILWLNGAYSEKIELTNVNKILAEYGINSFDIGTVYETNTTNTILGYAVCFKPEVQDTELTKDIYKGVGVTFLYPTKININTDKLSDLNVEEKDLIVSSDTTYFTSDLTGTESSNDEKGGFILGAEMVKTIKEATEDENGESTEALTSTLVIYGNDVFITDSAIRDNSGNNHYMIELYNNADLTLNSIAYLTKSDQNITIRKSYSDSATSFTPTDGEKSIIMKVIFIVPIAVILIGLIIWFRRKNRV